MKKGIIFDLDGTLWNATKQIADFWKIFFQEKNIDITIDEHIMASEMGKLVEEIADDLLSHIAIPKRYELLNEACANELDYLLENHAVIYEGLEDTLKSLQKEYTLCIVSNCQKGYIETFLATSGLSDYFTDTENAQNTGLKKADNIKLVIKRNSLDKTYYVGDTLGDMKSSDEAGSIFIHAKYGFGKVSQDRISINDIRDLPSFLEKEDNE